MASMVVMYLMHLRTYDAAKAFQKAAGTEVCIHGATELLAYCRPVRVAIANLKGGVGKTTTAVFMAELAAEREGPALLVDADPQGSAMGWADGAAETGDGLRAVAVSLPTADLPRRLSGIASGYGTVIVDTPPGQLGIVQAAARAADAVVVPCQPTLMDLDRMRVTVEVAAELGRPTAVLLTRTRAGTRALAAAREALEAAELPVLSTVIPQREAISAAYGERPKGETLALYAGVLDEIEAAVAALQEALA